mmetsp:Transcript_18411/g.58528  ORF Transcript_18411/g.58528 Transcript_18411/m.58528 type:complete len:201 (-) Transcript_18411:215-817(-)
MTPPESLPLPRAGARESSSSKKSTQGCMSRAFWKRLRTFRSLSPMYMESSSGPLTLRKCTRHSVATALASSVLPVPGGPKRRTPLRTFSPAKRWPCESGSVMQFMISSFAPCRPPMSAHCTLDARVTATFVPPWRRCTAFSMRSTSEGTFSPSPPDGGWQSATSLQTERRSVIERPVVSLAIALAGVLSRHSSPFSDEWP